MIHKEKTFRIASWRSQIFNNGSLLIESRGYILFFWTQLCTFYWLTFAHRRLRRPISLSGAHLTSAVLRLQPIVLVTRILDDAGVGCGVVHQSVLTILDCWRSSAVDESARWSFARPLSTDTAGQFLQIRCFRTRQPHQWRRYGGGF